jgi:diaminopimelate epimerase
MRFFKYQGTGNDFIIFADRNQIFKLGQNQIAQLCHRRFGIGADGLMLLQNTNDYDFRMVYYNSDGSLGTMCGNGGRCLVRFAADLGIVAGKTNFMAVDGPHTAFIDQDTISLQMQNVTEISKIKEDYFTNTGSPHYVRFCEDVHQTDVRTIGAEIRYSETFASQGGTNVNFVQDLGQEGLFVRTYERGVEDETYSCGTGVTAAALCAVRELGKQSPIQIQTLGGPLSVSFEGNAQDGFTNIFLTGPAVKVFEGEITSKAL